MPSLRPSNGLPQIHRPRQWRRRPGMEPRYQWDFGSVATLLADIWIWELYNRPDDEHLLIETITQGLRSYISPYLYARRREIMRQAERAVRQAKSIVVGTLDDEEQLLDRLEWDVRYRRRRRVARAKDVELLFCQRKICRELRKLDRWWSTIHGVLFQLMQEYKRLGEYWHQYATVKCPRLRDSYHVTIEATEEQLDFWDFERSIFRRGRRFGIDPKQGGALVRVPPEYELEIVVAEIVDQPQTPRPSSPPLAPASSVASAQSFILSPLDNEDPSGSFLHGLDVTRTSESVARNDEPMDQDELLEREDWSARS